MTDAFRQKDYWAQYQEALKLFRDGDIAGSITAAKFNSMNRALPPYYYIKNCILVAGALDNWDQADLWKLSAEKTYEYCYKISVKNHDEASLRLLEVVREELDELEQYKQEDLLEEVMEMMIIDEVDEDDEDELYDEDYFNKYIEDCKEDDAEESEGEDGSVDGDEDGLVGGDKDVDVTGPLAKAET